MGSKSDWKAQIKRVIEEPAGPGGRNLLLETIEEFVAMLDESRWLHAELEQGSTPSLRSIVLAPRTRRNERNVILSLWVTPYSVSVVGEQGREFDDPGALQQFFIDFAKRSELARTTEEYRRLFFLPVTAILRTSYSVPYGPDDVTVIIDPVEQEKLARAVDSGQSEVVTVKAVPAPQGKPLDARVEHRFLDSAGLGLALTEEPRPDEDGSLRLTGTTFLMSSGAPPLRLVTNAGKCSLGSKVFGGGFVLTPDEAEELIATDARNREVLDPYLSGEDLNARPDQSATRFVINFRDWPLDRTGEYANHSAPVAADFPHVLARVESLVKPERLTKPPPVLNAPWWQFWRPRLRLYEAIHGLRRVIARARWSKHNALAFIDYRAVFSEQVVVFALDDGASFAALQSFAHGEWSDHQAPTMMVHSRESYAPADCFETFPFPPGSADLAAIGERYHEHRRSIMLGRQEGLTRTYNRFHDQGDTAADIQALRDLHVEMDEAVARAYGWDDLRLDHGFADTRSGVGFTSSAAARAEVLDRLLQLNHQRYAEEVGEGLHDPGKAKKTSVKKANAPVRPSGGRHGRLKAG